MTDLTKDAVEAATEVLAVNGVGPTAETEDRAETVADAEAPGIQSEAQPEGEVEEDPWPPRTPSTGEVVSLALGLLAVAILACVMNLPPASPSAGLNSWRPNDAVRMALESEWSGRVSEAPSQGQIRELEASIAAMHAASASGGDKTVRKAQAMYHEAVLEFARAHGEKAYAAAGAVLSEQFVRSLQVCWLQWHNSGLSLSEWVESAGADQDLGLVRRLSGGFLERAANSGLLIQGEGPDADRLLVARVMWQAYWLQGLGPDGPARYLTPLESDLVVKFKVENSLDLPIERRLAILGHLASTRRLPGYPLSFVKATLLAQAGRFQDAIEGFVACWVEGVKPDEAQAWIVQLRIRNGDYFQMW